MSRHFIIILVSALIGAGLGSIVYLNGGMAAGLAFAGGIGYGCLVTLLIQEVP